MMTLFDILNEDRAEKGRGSKEGRKKYTSKNKKNQDLVGYVPFGIR